MYKELMGWTLREATWRAMTPHIRINEGRSNVNTQQPQPFRSLVVCPADKNPVTVFNWMPAPDVVSDPAQRWRMEKQLVKWGYGYSLHVDSDGNCTLEIEALEAFVINADDYAEPQNVALCHAVCTLGERINAREKVE